MKKSEALRLINQILDNAEWDDDIDIFDIIIETAAEVVGIHKILVTGPTKEDESVVARRLCYRYLRSLGWTYKKIGDHFNLEHTAALYGYNKIKTFIEIGDKETVELVKEFDRLITEKQEVIN